MIGRWLATLAGADPQQWRLLTRVMLRTDFRSSNALNFGTTGKKHAGRPWAILLLYGVVGIWTAMIAALFSDLLLVSAVVLLAVGMIVAMAIVLDFHSAVLSPRDYRVLSPQPLTSATYFAARITSILIYAGVIGGLVGGPGAGVFLVRHGLSAALGLALGLGGTVLWTVLAFVIAYAAMVNRIHPGRLRLALSSLQIALMSVVMGAPAFMPFLEDHLQGTDYQAGPAVFLVPWGWFAGLPPLLGGDWSLPALGGLLAGLATTALLWRHARTHISLSGARRLDNLSSAGEATRPRRRPLWLRGGSPEQQAVATLTRAQFRSDMNFRLAVLSVVPITLIYLLMAVRNGPLPNPIVQEGASPGSRLFMIHLLTSLVPLTLMDSLVRSESSSASWVFFAAPADRARLIVGSGLCVSRFFMLPYAALLAAIFLWSWGNPGHALIHAAALGLLAHLVVQLRILLTPRLPFSEGVRKGMALNQIVTMGIAALLVSIVLPLLFGLAYASSWFTAALIALLMAAAVALPRAVERSVRARVERLEFGG